MPRPAVHRVAITPLVLALSLAACDQAGAPADPLAPLAGEAAAAHAAALQPVLLASGLQGGSGSTVGPGGALYVTEGAIGRISRIDPETGVVTTYASGLPTQIIPLGGAMDLEFIGSTAYVLVTLVGADLGGADIAGIYRVDGPGSFTVIADIGQWSIDHPPATQFVVPSGVHYAIEKFRGGFLVTDGHHNRLLYVTLDGEITELKAFDNIVPTGLEVHGNTILMGEAGPVPHLPQDGRIVSIDPHDGSVEVVATGARLLVDVERGRGENLYGLAQGIWPLGGPDGTPALPNTGALLQVDGAGGFTVLAEALNLPTSLEVIGSTAYVVTLTGEVWKIEGLPRPGARPRS